MSKITLPTITNGNNLSTLNANFQAIAEALNALVLYRDNPVGEPNQMLESLDMNGQDILNVENISAQDITVDGISLETQVANAALSATQAATSSSQAAISAGNASASASQAAAILANTLTKSNNLSDVANAATALSNLGGVNAAQASAAAPVQKVAGRTGNVTLTSADVSGVLVAANSLSDVASASTARTNLGLGTLATQNATSVAITGGSVAGVTGSFSTVQTSGNVGIGVAPQTTAAVQMSQSITGGTTAQGFNASPTVQSGVTTSASVNYSSPSTVAASFTLTELNHYDVTFGTLGAGSTITNQYGFRVRPTLTTATNNYAFRGQLAVATGRWNVYMDGTAANYFSGTVQIGSSTATTGAEKLQVGGSLSISSAVMLTTYTSFTNGAAAATGTLTNAPVAGNPTKWIPINDNGTTRYIPAW